MGIVLSKIGRLIGCNGKCVRSGWWIAFVGKTGGMDA